MSQRRSSDTGAPGGGVDCPRFHCQRPSKGLLAAHAALVASRVQRPMITVIPSSRVIVSSLYVARCGSVAAIAMPWSSSAFPFCFSCALDEHRSPTLVLSSAARAGLITRPSSPRGVPTDPSGATPAGHRVVNEWGVNNRCTQLCSPASRTDSRRPCLPLGGERARRHHSAENDEHWRPLWVQFFTRRRGAGNRPEGDSGRGIRCLKLNPT